MESLYMAYKKKLPLIKKSCINCREFFVINSRSWKVLGLIIGNKDNENSTRQQFTYIGILLWSCFLNLTVTFAAPLHFILIIFTSEPTKSESFESVAVFITSLGASLKAIMFVFNMRTIMRMEKILKALDERIHKPEDHQLFIRDIKRPLTYMARMYFTIYAGVGVFISVACVARGEEKLIYPGWLPFNWHLCWWRYTAALAYQVYIVSFQIIQNLACDSFSPKALCILAGHIKLLYKRVARIGYDESLTLKQHQVELDKCIEHQKDLYELFNTIQRIISWPMFCQMFVSLVNMGVALVALIFFVTNICYRIYNVVYFTAMILQLFPVCYYGSDVVMLFEQLHYAVFSCNWTGQTKQFKRHMLLFTERSLKVTLAKAGGVFSIHLATFFATCRGAYSMFTVLLTMK